MARPTFEQAFSAAAEIEDPQARAEALRGEKALEAAKRVDLYARTAKNSVEVHDQPDGTGNKDTL